VKDYIKQLIERTQDNNLARCMVREYLQARLLESLQENGAFVNWAFVGGTALRFLYSMPRFSEDLDFSLSHPNDDETVQYQNYYVYSRRGRVVVVTFGRAVTGEIGLDDLVELASNMDASVVASDL